MRRVLGSLVMLPTLLLLTISTALADTGPAPFDGQWTGTDPGDGSNLTVTISRGSRVVSMGYTDDNATTACADASSSVFTSVLTGTIGGNELQSTMRAARCGNQALNFRGFQITWWLDDGGNSDRSDDVLTNQFGEIYSRAD